MAFLCPKWLYLHMYCITYCWGATLGYFDAQESFAWLNWFNLVETHS
jgi:hypothetical protein